MIMIYRRTSYLKSVVNPADGRVPKRVELFPHMAEDADERVADYCLPINPILIIQWLSFAQVVRRMYNAALMRCNSVIRLDSYALLSAYNSWSDSACCIAS